MAEHTESYGMGEDPSHWTGREWISVKSMRGRPHERSKYVNFSEIAATLPKVPGYEDAARCEWATDGNGGLRLRVGDTGEHALGYRSFGTRVVATGSLQRALNRELRGKYPITSLEGRDVFIDISESL
jgi:hypothetical protein